MGFVRTRVDNAGRIRHLALYQDLKSRRPRRHRQGRVLAVHPHRAVPGLLRTSSTAAEPQHDGVTLSTGAGGADVPATTDAHDMLATQLRVEHERAQERVRNLEVAMESSRVIEAAVGIDMTTRKLLHEAAFDYSKPRAGE